MMIDARDALRIQLHASKDGHSRRRPPRGSASGSSNPPQPASKPALPRLGNLTVLVIEDHTDSRDLLRQMIEAMGGVFLGAGHGFEALDILRDHRPHVILCDLLMPEMDGFRFIQRLRANVEWRDIPIVAVTALGTDPDYRRTWEAGFDGHLTKPVDAMQLAAVIRAVWQARRRPPRSHDGTPSADH